MNYSKLEVSCSFCNKFQSEVRAVIKAERIFICDECVGLCSDMIHRFNLDQNKIKNRVDIMYPKEIKAKLDEEIVGQEAAKQALSVAAFMHTMRINTGKGAKANILLIGPTGCGKTRMMQILSEILKVPLAIADATTLTEAGYVGDDVESIISRLVQVADYNIEKAQQGIIYIDEIDKIARTSENRSISRDVSGEGVQQALLKIIEGTIATVPQKYNMKYPNQEMFQVDTKDILFICGGAFDGLEKIISNRFKASNVGINMQPHVSRSELNHHLDSQDLVKFGMIPELIGRLSRKVMMDHLQLEDYIKIITEPKSSIFNQYSDLLEQANTKLTLSSGAARRIAEESIKSKIGARGIRSVFEQVLHPIVYNIDNNDRRELDITEELVNESINKPRKTA